MSDANAFKLTVKTREQLPKATTEQAIAPVLEAIKAELLNSLANGVGDLAFHGSTSVSGLEAGQLNIARGLQQ